MTIRLTSVRCYKRGFKACVGKVKVVKCVIVGESAVLYGGILTDVPIKNA
jgi:hypothetical protein